MSEVVKEELNLFFPRMRVEKEADKLVGVEDGARYELLVKKREMLSFLQTLFFEERLIEVQLDQSTRLFYAGLWDHLPELEEQEQDGELVFVAPEYEEGSYLKDMEHLVLSPMEPVAGNAKVRMSSIVLLCFYTGTNAVELGTRFLRADSIRGESVLVFEFPAMGRLIRNNRPFRAKIIPEFEIIAHIAHSDRDGQSLDCEIMDISSHGIALVNEQLADEFHINDPAALTILAPGEEPLSIHGTVRHFAKIRTKKGNVYICGVLFDLETRELAMLVEQLFARVQRIFIRNLKERTEGQDIQLTLK